METSEKSGKVSAALVALAAVIQDPIKQRDAKISGRGGGFGYQFASLPDFLPAVRVAAAAQGLAIVQSCDGATITTAIVHTSGEWIKTAYPLIVANDPQKQGIAHTYARRYSLLAALGLAALDDDAQSFQASDVAPAPAAAGWESERAAFAAVVSDLGGWSVETVSRFCETELNRPPVSRMTAEQRARLLDWLAGDGYGRLESWAAKDGGKG